MTATPAERKALLFLSGVLCLGLAVRVAGAVRRAPIPAASRAALARQLEAVDSARRSERERGRGKGGGGRALRGCRASGAGCGRGSARDAPTAPDARHPTPAPRAAAPRRPPPLQFPIDVDTASALTLEQLPRIGPALARRIVEDRERNGSFGSLAALEQVRGIGPAMVRALQPNVTFSGKPRPKPAVTAPRRGRR